MQRTVLALLITALLVTTGCDRAGQDKSHSTASAGSDDAAADEGKGGDRDEAWDEKVQSYIKVGNRLRGFSAAPTNETIARWDAESEAKMKAGDFKEISSRNTYFSDSYLNDLKQAMQMPGKTPELDQAAQDVLTLANQYVPAWNELAEYNKAKRYEDDGGAKGRELLPKYQEGLPKLEAAMDKLSAQIDAASKIAHEKAVAGFKEEGKLLEMHTWEAMGSAEKVVDLFNEADDFKNEAKIKEANAHIAAMEASTAALRAEHEKRKAQKDSLPMIDRYDGVADELTEFAGQYREARKNPSEFNDAVSTYNDAVDELNMMSH